jgi:hypothetical protein
MEPDLDCVDVGNLTYHMLTGIAKLDDAGEGLVGQMNVRYKNINIIVKQDHKFDAMFFDFLECCNRENSSPESLLKVRYTRLSHWNEEFIMS